VEAPKKPPDEKARLAALRSLALLDTDPEERFDRVTRLAQRLFDVPIALVSIVDEDRQWFKSHQGLETTETPREVSFCGHAILGDDIMHVPDATLDERFSDNPLVTSDPNIRFYAGCPIADPTGAKLGTLCIIDRHARDLSDADAASLQDLAEMVEREIAALHLATVDELTGLSNVRGFELLGSKLLDVYRRQPGGVSLLYLDLDGFKAINDRFGHDEGDAALREFSDILEHTFRTSDIVARLGGDEFAVLLSGTQSVEISIARLNQALEMRNRATDSKYRLATSIGSSTFDPETNSELDQLVKRADAAMFEHKRSARDTRRQTVGGSPAER